MLFRISVIFCISVQNDKNDDLNNSTDCNMFCGKKAGVKNLMSVFERFGICIPDMKELYIMIKRDNHNILLDRHSSSFSIITNEKSSARQRIKDLETNG